jgi:tRNA(Ile)-lysidine synthase
MFGLLQDGCSAILAVSGGPDSTALLWLAARWRKSVKRGPTLIAVTIDHGLRPEAAGEAAAVHRLAAKLGIAHRTLRWIGNKPKTGLQKAAREARYRLLAQAAYEAGARYVFTAHTRDDQAETVLMRLLRGSGLEGLIGMTPHAAVPGHADLSLVRPLLHVSKPRLLATLKAAKIPYAEDPSNSDPRFARARLRGIMASLAREGLTVDRLLRLSARARRAEGVVQEALAVAKARLGPDPWPPCGPLTFEAGAFCDLSEEIKLRLLGEAIAWTGDEGPVELGKLESLYDTIAWPLIITAEGCKQPFRVTLAGALVTLKDGMITVERTPARRTRRPRPHHNRDALNHQSTSPPQSGQAAVE